MKVSSSQLGASMCELLVDPEPGDEPLVVGEAYSSAWRHHFTRDDGSAAFMDCPRSGYVVVTGFEPQADGRLKLTCDRSRWAVFTGGPDRIVLSNDEIPLLKRRVSELERAVATKEAASKRNLLCTGLGVSGNLGAGYQDLAPASETARFKVGDRVVPRACSSAWEVVMVRGTICRLRDSDGREKYASDGELVPESEAPWARKDGEHV